MATIDSRGFVDDGSGNLSVAGQVTVVGPTTRAYEVASVATAAGSGSLVALSSPGYYQVPVTGSAGQGQFTGSLPAAASFPGSHLMVVDTLGIYPYLLTGSMAMMSGTQTPSSTSMTTVNGTKLTVAQGGSVGLWSNGKGWLVCAASGTLTLAP